MKPNYSCGIFKRYDLIFLLLTGYYLFRCAAVSPPVGGPKDLQPPKLIQSKPKQDELNVNTRKIIFYFNEPVDASKLKDKIIVTPNFGTSVESEAIGKKLIVQLGKSTSKQDGVQLQNYKGTVTIQFPEGVKDITEGNTLKHLSLRYSTSGTLDTIFVEGVTTDFFTNDTLSKVLVGLYYAVDSITPLKHKPLFYTYSTDKGTFRIPNIKPGSYKLFAFTDYNTNHLYDNKKEKIYFTQATLEINKSVDTLKLPLFFQDCIAPRFLNIKNDQEIKLTFNEGIYKYQLFSDQKLYHKLSDDKKDIIIFKTDLCEDSIPVKIYATDSSENDTTFSIKIVQSPPRRFKTYKSIIKDVEPKDNSTIKDSLTITIQTSEPIRFEKDTSLVLIIDSLRFIYQNLNKNFKKDNSNTYFSNTYKLNFRIKDFIQIICIPKTLFSFKNDTNEFLKITLKSNTKIDKPDEEVFRTNITLETKCPNYLFQLLDAKFNVKESAINPKKLTYENLPEGYYHVRILIDENNNHKWDSGNLLKNTHPEPVRVYKKIIHVKKNWEIEDTTLQF